MQIGDQTITREQMPSFGMTQLNPDHIDQMLQDVLARNLTNQMDNLAMQAPTADMGARAQAGGAQ